LDYQERDLERLMLHPRRHSSHHYPLVTFHHETFVILQALEVLGLGFEFGLLGGELWTIRSKQAGQAHPWVLRLS
jgi:hypothetical protein